MKIIMSDMSHMLPVTETHVLPGQAPWLGTNARKRGKGENDIGECPIDGLRLRPLDSSNEALICANPPCVGLPQRKG